MDVHESAQPNPPAPLHLWFLIIDIYVSEPVIQMEGGGWWDWVIIKVIFRIYLVLRTIKGFMKKVYVISLQNSFYYISFFSHSRICFSYRRYFCFAWCARRGLNTPRASFVQNECLDLQVGCALLDWWYLQRLWRMLMKFYLKIIISRRVLMKSTWSTWVPWGEQHRSCHRQPWTRRTHRRPAKRNASEIKFAIC